MATVAARAEVAMATVTKAATVGMAAMAAALVMTADGICRSTCLTLVCRSTSIHNRRIHSY